MSGKLEGKIALVTGGSRPELAPQSPSVWPQTELRWPLHI